MKAVLISIRPKWVELIASGKKTIEVRKTAPEIKTPFKCYIYCTKDPGNKGSATHFFESDEGTFWSAGKTFAAFLSGKVIGEFICDRIFSIKVEEPGPFSDERGGGYDEKYSSLGYHDCLTDEEFDAYLNSKPGYGWHISNLRIYEKPLWISQMTTEKRGKGFYIRGPVLRPPQSWCYVEELTP